MSGGSLSYVYEKVLSAIDDIPKDNLLYQTFCEHMQKVAVALHDLEWALSGDYSDERAEESIRDIITPKMELEEIIRQGDRLLEQLVSTLARARLQKNAADAAD